jgi:hypothetical protein
MNKSFQSLVLIMFSSILSFIYSLVMSTLMKINKKVTSKLCDKRLGSCEKIVALGSNFDPEGSCNGEYEFINENEIICTLENMETKKIKLVVKTRAGQEDSLNITIFDSRCQNCQVILENIRCNRKEHVCALNGTCHEQGSIHPGDICQHCIEGRWRPKSGKEKIHFCYFLQVPFFYLHVL